MTKTLNPSIILKNGAALTSFNDETPLKDGPLSIAGSCRDGGADAIFVFVLSEDEREHAGDMETLKAICDLAEIPVYGYGIVSHIDDVKKLLYAGCAKVVMDVCREPDRRLLKEVSERFGRERILLSCGMWDKTNEQDTPDDLPVEAASGFVSFDCNSQNIPPVMKKLPRYIFVEKKYDAAEDIISMLKEDNVRGLAGQFLPGDMTCDALKKEMRSAGLDIKVLESGISWQELKKDDNGLVPCVVQDYRTDEVLMVAYMNEEALDNTLEKGRMCYYSRSRKEQWLKGETSGHYQFVKALYTDCDKDTILARVSQIGAACHTGSHSCFFNEMVKQDFREKNPMRVLDDVYGIILDRKEHPKEGSYTNYLLDKGIDKILKKMGEENTEIVIAAKNPDDSETKYEIADYLYHMLVLMAAKGISLEEVAEELARR